MRFLKPTVTFFLHNLENSNFSGRCECIERKVPLKNDLEFLKHFSSRIQRCLFLETPFTRLLDRLWKTRERKREIKERDREAKKYRDGEREEPMIERQICRLDT